MPSAIDNYQSSLALSQLVVLQGIFPSQQGGSTDGIPMGSIRTFGGSYAVAGGSAFAQGQIQAISQNTALFALLGTTYGGNGQSTFALPDLNGRVMVGEGQGPGLADVLLGEELGSAQITLSTSQLPPSVGGGAQPFDNHEPSLGITYVIRTEGFVPGSGAGVNFIGEIVPFLGFFAPGSFLEAAGQLLLISQFEALWDVIGTTYGGDGQTTFQLPDLRGRTPVGASAQLPLGTPTGSALTTITNLNLPVFLGGSGVPIDNHQPTLAISYLIALQGLFPPQNGGLDPTTQYLGEIVPFAGGVAPQGWALAQGQLLPIGQNQELFSLLGTTYGGNGQTTFALPDLRDRAVVGTGTSAAWGQVLGSNTETLLSSQIPDVHLVGTSGSNTLQGADGNDSINGAGGADTMIGGIGNDAYFVDNAGDVVTEAAGQGTDAVYASISYTLPANVENLFLLGTGDFSATGNALPNYIQGNTGNNVIDGGANGDTMAGGVGNDAYFVDNVGDLVVENPAEGTDAVYASINYTLPANVENLYLQGTGNISATGNALPNYIQGNTGNNVIDGKAGADVMAGGAGDDAYFVDNANDVVTENPNEGIDAVYASLNYTLTANVENLYLQGVGNFSGTGNGLANYIQGNTGNNVLDGKAGPDVMVGGIGADAYFVDDANDLVTENPGEGTDAIYASANYTLTANVENLYLQGTGDFSATGNTLVNFIQGNTGNNVLDGKGGSDTMQGGIGGDAYFVDNAGDVVVENVGEGIDAVYSTITYALTATVENLYLQGATNLHGAGNDLANYLQGNSGDNVLNGGANADALEGGSGNDTFVFNAGQANGDTIVDFAGNGAAAGDLIQFVGYGPGVSFYNINPTQWQLDFNGGASHDIITLANAAALHGSDFSFM